MQKEDWLRIAKWMGYVYLPIILLIIGIFILIEWNYHKIATLQPDNTLTGKNSAIASSTDQQ